MNKTKLSIRKRIGNVPQFPVGVDATIAEVETTNRLGALRVLTSSRMFLFYVAPFCSSSSIVYLVQFVIFYHLLASLGKWDIFNLIVMVLGLLSSEDARRYDKGLRILSNMTNVRVVLMVDNLIPKMFMVFLNSIRQMESIMTRVLEEIEEISDELLSILFTSINRKNEASDTGKVTLAIGDEGNNVRMLQESDIGAAISGVEGMQDSDKNHHRPSSARRGSSPMAANLGGMKPGNYRKGTGLAAAIGKERGGRTPKRKWGKKEKKTGVGKGGGRNRKRERTGEERKGRSRGRRKRSTKEESERKMGARGRKQEIYSTPSFFIILLRHDLLDLLPDRILRLDTIYRKRLQSAL
ncbi:hypothetical protein AgCh_022454 [Apium graveolens]